jgi:Tfp pilus assembly protein PilF
VLNTTFVSVDTFKGPVTIRLPDAPAARPVSGAVSAAILAHRVPAKAAAEFRRAMKAASKPDHRKTAAHCEKALRIDPDYFDARRVLAIAYMNLGDYGNAAAQFRAAAALDPSSAEVLAGLAGALCTLGRCAEAEPVARQAAAVQPRYLKAHYFLGLIRHRLGLYDEETLRALERAAPEFPKARLVAAEILAAQPRAFSTSSTSAGTTSNKSPTIP